MVDSVGALFALMVDSMAAPVPDVGELVSCVLKFNDVVELVLFVVDVFGAGRSATVVFVEPAVVESFDRFADV